MPTHTCSLGAMRVLCLAIQLKSRVIKGTSGGTAFQFGACKDSQVAADTNSMSGSAYTGAATFSFIDAVERYGPQQSYARCVRGTVTPPLAGPAGALSELSCVGIAGMLALLLMLHLCMPGCQCCRVLSRDSHNTCFCTHYLAILQGVSWGGACSEAALSTSINIHMFAAATNPLIPYNHHSHIAFQLSFPVPPTI